MATSQYKPQLLNRVGFVDLNALAKRVAEDIEIARGWKPGTIPPGGQKTRGGDTPFHP